MPSCLFHAVQCSGVLRFDIATLKDEKCYVILLFFSVTRPRKDLPSPSTVFVLSLGGALPKRLRLMSQHGEYHSCQKYFAHGRPPSASIAMIPLSHDLQYPPESTEFFLRNRKRSCRPPFDHDSSSLGAHSTLPFSVSTHLSRLDHCLKLREGGPTCLRCHVCYLWVLF